MDPAPDRLKLECPSCGRRAFAWARPRCQYCGHEIPARPDFDEARARLEAVYEESEREYKRIVAELKKSREVVAPGDV